MAYKSLFNFFSKSVPIFKTYPYLKIYQLVDVTVCSTVYIYIRSQLELDR